MKRIFSDVILSSYFKMLFEEDSGLEWNNCTCMSFVCHLHVLLGILMSSVCNSYVLLCHSYVTRMYSCVIRMSLACTFMSFVCHSYVVLPWQRCWYFFLYWCQFLGTRYFGAALLSLHMLCRTRLFI